MTEEPEVPMPGVSPFKLCSRKARLASGRGTVAQGQAEAGVSVRQLLSQTALWSHAEGFKLSGGVGNAEIKVRDTLEVELVSMPS